MKYIQQFGIIMLITLIGELLHLVIPLLIPGSIYGMLLLLFLLITGIVKLEQVKETGLFLIAMLSLIFVPSAVGIMTMWGSMKHMIAAVILALIVVTLLTMAASGHAAQFLIRRQKKNHDK